MSGVMMHVMRLSSSSGRNKPLRLSGLASGVFEPLICSTSGAKTPKSPVFLLNFWQYHVPQWDMRRRQQQLHRLGPGIFSRSLIHSEIHCDALRVSMSHIHLEVSALEGNAGNVMYMCSGQISG